MIYRRLDLRASPCYDTTVRGGTQPIGGTGPPALLTSSPAKPFVKWVGGKRQLLSELLPIFSASKRKSSYHEPFVGGGAVFFALRSAGVVARARLADANRELIESYVALRDFPERVIACLRGHQLANSEEYFYALRRERPDTPPAVAARLIYLNKTCFNGLYRVNRAGGFNSPWGRYVNPNICDEDNLRAVSKVLAGVALEVASFLTVLDHVTSGDLVYFDPPYVPVSPTSHFTEYCADGFGAEQQEQLASTAHELGRRNVQVVISNSDVPEVRRLYAGFRIRQVFARRNVNNRGDRRGPVPELVISNF